MKNAPLETFEMKCDYRLLVQTRKVQFLHLLCPRAFAVLCCVIVKKIYCYCDNCCGYWVIVLRMREKRKHNIIILQSFLAFVFLKRRGYRIRKITDKLPCEINTVKWKDFHRIWNCDRWYKQLENQATGWKRSRNFYGFQTTLVQWPTATLVVEKICDALKNAMTLYLCYCYGLSLQCCERPLLKVEMIL